MNGLSRLRAVLWYVLCATVWVTFSRGFSPYADWLLIAATALWVVWLLGREESLPVEVIQKAAEGFCVCEVLAEHPFLTFTVWNDRIERITGRTREEVNRLGWLKLFHPDPDNQERARLRLIELRAGKELSAEEWDIVRADGERRTLSISTGSLRAHSGRVHVLARISDITEQKQAVEALRQSEERFRELADRIKSVFWVTCPLLRQVHYVSPAFENIWGRSCESLLKDPLLFVEALHPEDLQRALGIVVGEDGVCRNAFEVEFRIVRPDGGVRWILDRGFPIQDEAGNVVRITGLAEDITERKQAEEELRFRNALFSAQLEVSIDGILVVDADDRVLVRNQRFVEMFHLPPDLAACQVDAPMLQYVTGLVVDPEAFVAHVRHLYGNRHEVSRDEVLLRDGRHIDRYSAPITGSEGGYYGRVWYFRDISERKRAEDALRASEEKYRGIFDDSVAAILLFDSQKRFVGANRAGIDLLGYSREELMGMSVADVDADPVVVLPAHRDLLGGRNLVNYEHRLRRKDGRVITVLNNSIPLTDGAGNITGMQSTLIDITEIRRAEEALRQGLLFRREAEKIGRTGAWKVNPRTDYLYWTEGVYEIVEVPLDYRPGLEEGLRFYDPESVPVLREALQRALQDGTPFRLEVGLTTATGRHRWTEVRGLGRIEEGGDAFVMGTFQDITERREAEAALRESEQKYRSLFDSSGDAVLLTAPHGLIIEANAEACRIFGRGEDELRLMRRADLVDSSDRRVAALLQERARTGRARGEITMLRCDGSRFPAEVSTSVFTDREGNVRSSMIIRDITQRKNVEEQLIQARKMESIGRLAGGVAHDFNNLLTVVNGFSEYLLARVPEADPLRDAIQEIHQAGQRAASLTRQLLAFSRRQALQLRVLNPNDAIREMRRLLQRVIGEDVTLVVNLDPLVGNVKADATQLDQVLLNLAVNARDAMQNGGQLVIQTANVAVDEAAAAAHPEAKPGPYVLLSVSDTGVGMDAETLSRLFEPFFTTKPKGSGTGLGLATVYGVVEQCGGWVSVESEVGKGTTFRIYLPLTHETPSRAPDAGGAPLQEKGSGQTILVVEDQVAVRKFVASVLHASGYRVLEAANGEDALGFFAAESPAIDLVLTDMVMPGLSGSDLVDGIRVTCPTVRALFMTGYAQSARANAGILLKPFSPAELAKRVREALA